MSNYFQISLNTNWQLVITYPRVIVGIEKGSVLAMEKKCGKLERSEVAHLELMFFGALHSAILIAAALFVFSIDGLKQNAGSLLTPVSYTVFYALSYGTLGFALHGSFLNHFLIGQNSSNSQTESLK